MPAVSALWFGIKWNGPNAAAVGTYPPKRLSKARVVTRRGRRLREIAHGKEGGDRMSGPSAIGRQGPTDRERGAGTA